MPQSAATIGADCPIAYEIATPVCTAATRLNTVPVVQIAPPSSPSRCPLTGPSKNPRNATGLPTSGLRMKYTFQTKHETSAPNVRKTVMLYGPRAFPCVIARVENGAHSPISTPDTTHVTMLFREISFPPVICP